MERPRAADDFDVIRERLEELRREREEISPSEPPAGAGSDSEEDAEKRRQERCDGVPPSWVPTIFLPQPTD